MDSKTFDELRRSLKTSPKLGFKEIDCSLLQNNCSMINSKKSSSFLLMNKNTIVDVYYGPHKLESLRNYCLVQMGFKIPRSLPLGEVIENEKFTALLLSSNDFDDGVKSDLTFVM